MLSTVDFFYNRKNTVKGKVRVRKRIDLILSYLWFAESLEFTREGVKKWVITIRRDFLLV